MDNPFDGLARAIGDGISGLVTRSLATIGAVVDQVVGTVANLLPFPWLPVILAALAALFVGKLLRR